MVIPSFHTKQLSQTIIPRVSVNEPVLDMMAEVLPMARTNMIASCGVKGVRVNDADQQQNVADGSRSLMNASLTGDPWVPIIGNIEFQELTDNATGKNQDYFLALQKHHSIPKVSLVLLRSKKQVQCLQMLHSKVKWTI